MSAERDGFLCWSARGRAGWFSGPDSWLFCLEIAGKHVLSLWNRGIPDSRWLGRRCLESIWWPFIGVFCESGLRVQGYFSNHQENRTHSLRKATGKRKSGRFCLRHVLRMGIVLVHGKGCPIARRKNRFDPIYRTCLELFLRKFANDHDRSEGKR